MGEKLKIPKKFPQKTMLLFKNLAPIVAIFIALFSHVEIILFSFEGEWIKACQRVFTGITSLLFAKSVRLNPGYGRITVTEFIWGWMFIFSLIFIAGMIMMSNYTPIIPKMTILCYHLLMVVGYMTRYETMILEGRAGEVNQKIVLWVQN